MASERIVLPQEYELMNVFRNLKAEAGGIFDTPKPLEDDVAEATRLKTFADLTSMQYSKLSVEKVNIIRTADIYLEILQKKDVGFHIKAVKIMNDLSTRLVSKDPNLLVTDVDSNRMEENKTHKHLEVFKTKVLELVAEPFKQVEQLSKTALTKGEVTPQTVEELNQYIHLSVVLKLSKGKAFTKLSEDQKDKRKAIADFLKICQDQCSPVNQATSVLFKLAIIDDALNALSKKINDITDKKNEGKSFLTKSSTGKFGEMIVDIRKMIYSSPQIKKEIEAAKPLVIAAQEKAKADAAAEMIERREKLVASRVSTSQVNARLSAAIRPSANSVIAKPATEKEITAQSSPSKNEVIVENVSPQGSVDKPKVEADKVSIESESRSSFRL